MSSDLEPRRLRSFIAVATELHFGRAAENLHIAQPALSQQIRHLEAQVGVQLLRRSTRSVSLTPAGQHLLDRGRTLLAHAEDTVEEVRRIGRGEQGSVRLGFIGSATYGLMPRAARTLREHVPYLRITLQGEQMSAPLARSVHDGLVDVAVLRPCPETAGLRTRQLLTERMVAAVPEDHPLAAADVVNLSDLSQETFVTFPPESSAIARQLRAATVAAGFDPAGTLTVGETSTLITMVASGLGVALVPEGVQRVRIPGASYRRLLPEITVPLLIARRDTTDEPAASRVADVVARSAHPEP